MYLSSKKLVISICAIAIILLPLSASSFAKSEYGKEGLTTDKMAVDLAVIRPVAIVGTIVGCALYVTSLPFSIPGGNSKEVLEKTVKKPAKFTFVRPLGDF